METVLAVLRDLTLFVLLALCWLLWSGIYEPLILSFGLASCLLVVWLVHRMDRIDGSHTDWGLVLRSPIYLPWLIKEIVLSNLAVARIILSPKMPIRPQLVRLTASQNSEIGRVIYANSITLTPGTITLDLRGDQLLVHALADPFAEGLREGEMDRRVTDLEGDR